MYNQKKSALIRIVAILLIMVLVAPVGASATTVQPRASSYLDNYAAYVYLPGDGEVQVYFNAQGAGMMDELGALTIELYECSTNSSNLADWTWIKTFKHNTTSGMLGYNKVFHSGHVSYNGTAGKYYKAYVCIWGGKDGAGDTRYFWTSVKH